MQKHTDLQSKWLKQIEKIAKKKGKDDIALTTTKRMMNRSLRNSSIGSLIERQNSFTYDDQGSKKPSMFWAHKSPKRDEVNKADLQKRVNSFYQDCR